MVVATAAATAAWASSLWRSWNEPPVSLKSLIRALQHEIRDTDNIDAVRKLWGGLLKYQRAHIVHDVANHVYKSTALHWACESSSLDMVRYLVEECGSNVHATIQNTGWTPLHTTLAYRRCRRSGDDHETLRIAQYLALRGADIGAVDHLGRTPLMCAILHGGGHLFTISINDWTFIAIKQQHQQQKSIANVQDWRDMTALMYACQQGQTESVRFLVTIGQADVTIVNDNPSSNDLGACTTALHYACRYQAHQDVIQCLVQDGGANIDAVNAHGATPLHEACAGTGSERCPDENSRNACRLKMVQYMVEKGCANIDVTDKHGWTALHHACLYGNVDIVYYLAQASTAISSSSSPSSSSTLIDVCDENGMTALQHAVVVAVAVASDGNNRTKSILASAKVRTLITAGRADLNVTDLIRTAWHKIMASSAPVDNASTRASSAWSVIYLLLEHSYQ